MTEGPSPMRLAIGDLGPARRHIARLLTGQLSSSRAVLQEIEAALERCAARLEAIDREGLPREPAG